MQPVDPIRLSKTMAFLLRHRPDVGGLKPDAEGWVTLADLCQALSRLLKVEVPPEMVRRLVAEARVRRFEVEGDRVRAMPRTAEREGEQRRCQPPDILYHATTEAEVERVLASGTLSAGADRHVFLSSDEAHAWRVAHRLSSGAPRVLVVDAARARRHGVRFYRNRRNGQYLSTPVPVHDLLNLQVDYEEQVSAGGIPLTFDGQGPRLALIRVARRSGVTWEVAKGKLEPGESPELCAIREVREEMGLEVDLTITRYLGVVRYGFLAPGGLPRLKTVHLYLMRPEASIDAFAPSEREGIGEVGWFSPEEACRAVTHTSLVPLMHRARALIEAEGEAVETP